jgi:hypothetical protein
MKKTLLVATRHIIQFIATAIAFFGFWAGLLYIGADMWLQAILCGMAFIGGGIVALKMEGIK